MSASGFTLIGLGLCVLIILVLCFLAIRRFDRFTFGDAPGRADDDVLELNQLSFDQVAAPQSPQTAQPEPEEIAQESTSEAAPSKAASAAAAPVPSLKLADVEFGVRPETLIIDGMRPRLEYSMALLNQADTTLVSIRVISDLVIYDNSANQATRPSGPTMRQDTLARLSPGERIILQGDWKLPEGLQQAMERGDGRGVYLLVRARIIGANVAPKSQFFLLGHLLPNSRLVPIRNRHEALINLGVTEARAKEDANAA